MRTSARLSPPNGGPVASRRWSPLLMTVVVMILLYVWRLQDLYPIIGATKAPLLILGVAAAVLMADGGAMRRKKRLRHPIVKYALIVLAFVVISVPLSLYQGKSIDFLMSDHSKTIFLMILVVLAIRSFKDVERLVGVLVAGAALYSYYINTKFTIGESGRLGDLIYYDANDLGMLVVASVPLCLYFVQKARAWHFRILGIMALGLFVQVVIKTGSRGAFLALIAVGAFLMFKFTAIPKKVRFGSVAAILVLMTALASDQYWEMMSTLLNPTADYNWSGNNNAGRMEVWKRGIGYMMQRPLNGVGARCFSVAEGTISPLADLQKEGIGVKWSAAHSSFVEIGAELGVLGLIAFVLLLVWGFKTSWALAKPRRVPPTAPHERAMAQALVGALIGYVVAGFFLSQGYSAYMYILMGIITAFAAVVREREAMGPPGVVVPARTARRRGAPVAGPVPVGEVLVAPRRVEGT